MILGIDIDDTISDTFEKLMNYAQEYTIEYLNREPILREDSCLSHYYVEFLHNWSREETIRFFEIYYKRIINEVIPKTLSVKYLNKIHEDGNQIILITARSNPNEYDVEDLTKEWLINNNIPFDKLIVDAQDKAEICKRENIELFIDDSAKNCEEVSKEGIKAFLMDTRANLRIKVDGVDRVYSWPHVYEKIYKK